MSLTPPFIAPPRPSRRSAAPSRALDTEALADIAFALVCAEPIWQGRARFDPDTRQPLRLFADDSFEAWVIGWFSGQGLALHDHGASAGAIVVVEGRLHETTLSTAATGGRRLETRALDRGVVRRLPPQTVHSVANVDARAATSIHVYSPPLSTMTRFDPATFQPTRTDPITSEAPALPTAVAQLMRIDRRL